MGREQPNPSLEDEALFKGLSAEEKTFYAQADPVEPPAAAAAAPAQGGPAGPEASGAPAPTAGTAAAAPPLGAAAPLSLDSVAATWPEDFFHRAQKIQDDSKAGKGPSIQTMAEAAARANPNIDLWKKAHEKAYKEGVYIAGKIEALPPDQKQAEIMKQQKAVMGSAQKVQFFGEGWRVLQEDIDARVAAKRAASAVPTPTRDPQVAATRARAGWPSDKNNLFPVGR